MFGNDRHAYRHYFASCWQRQLRGEPLSPLERLICEVVALHPEYHSLLTVQAEIHDRDFPGHAGAVNPFLHLGLHISLLEQLQTDRPPGVLNHYHALTLRLGDHHAAAHAMMECLEQILWQAQSSGQPPDERVYVHCLSQITQVDIQPAD